MEKKNEIDESEGVNFALTLKRSSSYDAEPLSNDSRKKSLTAAQPISPALLMLISRSIDLNATVY